MYPLRPPSFRFLTPSGRFEVNREICLSISGHHEESWQPAWGIRTALTAIRSFMDTDVKGQVGGLQCDEAGRRQFAVQSREWMCPGCRKNNKVIMDERDEECKLAAVEGKEKKEEVVPQELRLAYREDLAASSGESKGGREVTHTPAAQEQSSQPMDSPSGLATVQAPRRPPTRSSSDDAWIDKAIYAVAALLAILVARKLLLFL